MGKTLKSKIGWTDEMIEKQSRIIDVEGKPQKCPVCGERVVDIIYGTGDMTEIEFVMEYRKEGMMGGDNIPRRPPIWECVCEIRGRFFDPFLIKGLKYPVRNKSH